MVRLWRLELKPTSDFADACRCCCCCLPKMLLMIADDVADACRCRCCADVVASRSTRQLGPLCSTGLMVRRKKPLQLVGLTRRKRSLQSMGSTRRERLL